ncbi:F-box/LRR protein [Medicago truncatula]|uniref:F-box/LRR protein n=2 Tax=Medicago truncatula TaxID=3880 RepID=A0A072UZR8_MEDTR|nr:F-box/LRR protein [Medicago truncatula]
MASCSFTAKEAECKSTMVPNWLELLREITANILQRLDTIEIVKSACQVCPLWWDICKDPLLWRTIHIRIPCMSLIHFNYQDLTRICCYAVERSCGHLEDINIEYSVTDELLEFIAENGRNLRCMRIFGLQLSDKGFIEALRKLPQLEEVDIS